jgi:hypothetical protein
MKFKITLKDPDGYSDSVDRAVGESLEDMDADPDEIDACNEIRTEKVHESLEKWFSYQEYLTIEVDTVAGTAVVCETR